MGKRKARLLDAVVDVWAAKRAKQVKEAKEKRQLALKKSGDVKRVMPYKPAHRILLIGEGNFSFAASLIRMGMTDIIATAFDSKEILEQKYPEVKEHIAALDGVTVLYEVDGTRLQEVPELRGRTFDRIVFNFPHSGSGIKDQTRNVASNQRLIVDFCRSASQFLSSGVNASENQGADDDFELDPERTLSADKDPPAIIITSKDPSIPPYSLWNIRQLVKEELSNLAIKTSFAFIPSMYKGYTHRRTLGFKEGLSKAENEEIGGSPRSFMLVDKVHVAKEVDSARKGMEKRKAEKSKPASKRRK